NFLTAFAQLLGQQLQVGVLLDVVQRGAELRHQPLHGIAIVLGEVRRGTQRHHTKHLPAITDRAVQQRAWYQLRKSRIDGETTWLDIIDMYALSALRDSPD